MWLGSTTIRIKKMNQESQNIDKKKLRMILKFDTGADGFLKMIWVLAACAIIVILTGTYFLLFYYQGIKA